MWRDFLEHPDTSVIFRYTMAAKEGCQICGKLENQRHLSANELNCCYGTLYNPRDAAILLAECEEAFEYFTGNLARVKVFGNWHEIPRKQVAYGDRGLKYRFSGLTVPARTWPPFLSEVRDRVSELVGWRFNFVLVNRYNDGGDYMGEHRDDEKDLVKEAPIASLSLGKSRDFVLRHHSVRSGKKQIPGTDTKKIELRSGSLLVMNYPTNVYWYHSLPKRRNTAGVRVNMTFRVLKTPKRDTCVDGRV